MAPVPRNPSRNLTQVFDGQANGADKDEELVYRLTKKTLYENREAVVRKHAAGRAIDPENAVRDTGTEFHPGAVRYYCEIGIWSEG